MALIAVTDIDHGKALADGSVEQYYFEVGDEVDTSKFTEEELKSLRDVGAVEESAQLQEVDDLRKQVEELQTKLASMESASASKSNLVTGARAVDQTALDPQRGVPAGTVVEKPKATPTSAPTKPAQKS